MFATLSSSDREISRARQKFQMVDAAARTALAAFLPILEAELPSMLDAFCVHLGSCPTLAGKSDRNGALALIKDLQHRHWLSLFSGRFADDYFESACCIGDMHERLGLEPRWYIGGYAETLHRLLTAAAASYVDPWRPTQAMARITAINRALSQAAMLDVDLVVAINLEQRARIDATRPDAAS